MRTHWVEEKGGAFHVKSKNQFGWVYTKVFETKSDAEEYI